MHLLHLFLFIFLFIFCNNSYHFCMVSCPSWMDPRFLTVCRQQLSNPPSAFSVHSFFLIWFSLSNLHNLHSLLPLHLLFFRWLLLLALQPLQVVVSEQGEDSCQQSSLHFLILYFLLLRTRLNSSETPLPLKASLLLSSTLHLSRTSASIFPAKFFQHWSITSWLVPLHFLISSVSSSQKTVRLVFHLFHGPSFHFLLFFCALHFFTVGHSFMYHKLWYLLLTSTCKEIPSILLRSTISSNFSSSSHRSSILFSFCQSSSSSSSSFSICEQSQICLNLCPTVLCAVALASSCALAFSLTPTTTSWAISFLILLSSLSLVFLTFFSAFFLLCFFRATFLSCNQAIPSADSARSIPAIFSLNQKGHCFVRPRLKVFHHLCEIFPLRLLHAIPQSSTISFHSLFAPFYLHVEAFSGATTTCIWFLWNQRHFFKFYWVHISVTCHQTRMSGNSGSLQHCVQQGFVPRGSEREGDREDGSGREYM